MPNMLKKLKLTELSLVDRPANPEAIAPIFKSDSPKGEKETMDKLEKLLKSYMEKKDLTEAEARVALFTDLEKAFADAEKLTDVKSENEKLRKALIDNDFVITADAVEKKDSVEYIEVEGEQINKADVPAPILKKLEAAEMEKADRELMEKAEQTLPNFNKDIAKRLLAKGLEDDILEALIAADKLFDSAMGEIGAAKADTTDMVEAEEKLEQLTKAYQKEHGVAYQTAYAKVTKTAEGKSLVKEIYKKD